MAGQDGNPGNPLGLQTPGFNASFAFFLVFMGASGFPPFLHTHTHMNTHSRFHTRENEWEQDKANAKVSAHTGLICFIFLICSLRTNIVFFLIFLTLVGAFGCLSAAYWNLALAYENAENTAAAKRAGQLVVVRLLFSLLSPSILFLPSFLLSPYKQEKEKTQSYKRTELTPDPLSFLPNTGRRRLHFRHFHGGLVELLRHHARVVGFPVWYPCGRPFAYY